jgi:pSer/pThr/pTyr-binding forkhead associated (FHA) protein
MARLVLLSEGFTGRTYELKTEKTTVGRLPDNTFEIPEQSVSSHHCEIHLRGGEVLVRDLDSTNGTFINGEKTSESVLKPGQILRLGSVEMRLESGAPHPPPSPKNLLDQTRPIPQGVKLDELQGTRTTSLDGKTGFEKRSNRATRVFIALVIVVGVILVLLLLVIVLRTTR